MALFRTATIDFVVKHHGEPASSVLMIKPYRLTFRGDNNKGKGKGKTGGLQKGT